jgi:hypothetical protein
VLALLLISVTPMSAQAQLEVQDLITEFQTTITAVQTTISAGEAVIHTAKWILEQTPLDELAMGEEWVEDLRTMESLVREAQALGYDINSLRNTLRHTFSLESAASNSIDFESKMFEMRRAVSQGYTYAVTTQGLIQTSIRTVTHMLSIYKKISELLGNLSGQQNLSESLSKLQQLAAEEKVAGNAYRLAQGFERLQEPVIVESLYWMNQEVMKSHPR